ncbi:hypothetical protein ACOMHN_009994 [Nucella lapillus]
MVVVAVVSSVRHVRERTNHSTVAVTGYGGATPVTQRASAGTLSPANQHVEGGEVTGIPAVVTSRDNPVVQEGEDGTRQADRLGYVATLVTRLGASEMTIHFATRKRNRTGLATRQI